MIHTHSIETPPWLAALADDVAVCVHPTGFIGTMGYRFWAPDDPDNVVNGWQIAIYPTPNVAVGPTAIDGAKLISGFRFDLGQLTSMMCSVDELVWNQPAKQGVGPEGPELCVVGKYTGKHVCIRIFGKPPDDEEPAYALDLTTGSVHSLAQQ